MDNKDEGGRPYSLIGERVKMSDGGRIVIPLAVREAMGVKPGDEVILTYDGHSVRVYTLAEAIRQAQELVSRHVGAGRSLSQELISERRREEEHG